MTRALALGFAVGFGLASATTIMKYAATPELNNINLLENEAAYIQQYEGPNPADALDHALESINVVKVTNPEYAMQITNLEAELNQSKAEITAHLNSPNYQDLIQVSDEIEEASSKLETFVKENSRDDSRLQRGFYYLGAAIASGMISLMGRDDN